MNYRYYFAKVILITFTPFLPTFAYVADVISPPSRTIAFALTGIVFGFAYSIGPMLVGSGAIASVEVGCYVSLALVGVSTLACILFIPESLSKEIMKSSRDSAEVALDKSESCAPKFVVRSITTFWDSFSILFRSRLFQKLTLCIFVLYVNFEEVFDMEAQYFQEVANFGTKDLATLYTIAGVSGLFVVTLGIWMMVSLLKMSDKSILIAGMLALAVQQVLYIFLRQKLAIFIATGMGTAANLVFPAINSIKSRNVGVDEQGALQGAIVSVQSVARGISPVMFLLFFKVFRSKGLYFPGAPFLVGLLLLVGGIAVAFTLKVAQPYGRQPQYSKLDMGLSDDQHLLDSHPVAFSSDGSDDYET